MASMACRMKDARGHGWEDPKRPQSISASQRGALARLMRRVDEAGPRFRRVPLLPRGALFG